jgi:hypothetical protein
LSQIELGVKRVSLRVRSIAQLVDLLIRAGARIQHFYRAAPLSLKAAAARLKKEALQRSCAAQENQY